MLSDIAALLELAIDVSREAVARAYERDDCALCHRSELRHDASAAEVEAWLGGFDAAEAERLRAGVADPYVSRARAHADSQLRIGVAVPLGVLEAATTSSDWTFDEWLPEHHLERFCEWCVHAETPAHEVADRFRDVYVERRFDGNEAAARAQRSWEIVERLTTLIARAARTLHQSA